MRNNKVVWFAGCAGLLLSLGVARAQTGTEDAASEEPICKDAGVTVSFANASTTLDKNARGGLTGLATWMKAKDERTVKLQGYASPTGNAEVNQKLSEQRADAVKNYLTAQGIDPERISTNALGETQDRPPTAEGRKVTVTACDQPVKVVEAEKPAEEPAPPPPPVAVEPEPAAPVTIVVPPPAPVSLAPPPAKPPGPPSRIGIEAAVGAGAIGFTDGATRGFTNTGTSWDARMIFGSRSPIAIEAAYVGSAQGINALGLDNDALLVGQGAEGNLRLNLTTRRVQPYLFGGIGWTRYNLERTTTSTSSVRAVDDVGTVPMGVGLTARLTRSFFIDARGTYRYSFYDNMLDVASSSAGLGDAPLQTWNASGRLGFEF
jgi:outer membrane protein OmpA-like peptidoglycan-associated protein